MKCWASILGDCSGGQSREHYLTKGLYRGNVKAIGLPWSKGQTIQLPSENLTANILCKHHNQTLSQVDAEAIRMRDFLAQAVKEASTRSRSGPVSYCTLEWRNISRWFSKFVCNIESLAKRTPDERYVRHAFGQPNTSVSVYVDKMHYPKTDGDVSHIHYEQWVGDLKDGGQTAVYVVRFAVLDWLIAPSTLTQQECDALGKLSGNQHWFRAKPIEKTKRIPVGTPAQSGKIQCTHWLILRVPRRRRKRP